MLLALTVPTLGDSDYLLVSGAILVLIAGFYGVRKALALLQVFVDDDAGHDRDWWHDRHKWK